MITIRQGEKVICSKKLRKALPAEMIHLDIPYAALSGDSDLEVSAQ